MYICVCNCGCVCAASAEAAVRDGVKEERKKEGEKEKCVWGGGCV